MTMQVGLVASDGIVIASDKKLSYSGAGTNQAATTDKITWNDDQNILCADAGFRTSNTIASQIVNLDTLELLLEPTDFRWRQQLFKTASGVSRPSVLNPLDEVIVVRRDSLDKFWIVGKTTGSGESVDSVSDRLVTGDTGNLGRLWPSFFYKSSMNVTEMSFLAVLTIWWGEKHNPSSIGNGIDLVVCTKTGFQVQPAERFVQRCEDFHSQLSSIFDAIAQTQ